MVLYHSFYVLINVNKYRYVCVVCLCWSIRWEMVDWSYICCFTWKVVQKEKKKKERRKIYKTKLRWNMWSLLIWPWGKKYSIFSYDKTRIYIIIDKLFQFGNFYLIDPRTQRRYMHIHIWVNDDEHLCTFSYYPILLSAHSFCSLYIYFSYVSNIITHYLFTVKSIEINNHNLFSIIKSSTHKNYLYINILMH
jgi:hypothetical protein